MIIKNHNDNSKQLLQKVLIYIDSVLLNTATTNPDDVHKVLLSGLINVRDVLFSEIVKENHTEKINQQLEEISKKNTQEDLNQEIKSEKDQKV